MLLPSNSLSNQTIKKTDSSEPVFLFYLISLSFTAWKVMWAWELS